MARGLLPESKQGSITSLLFESEDRTLANEQVIQGRWNEIKGQVKSKWGQITDDDLQDFQGDVDQLIGTIQRKTGEAREGIEQFFEDLSTNGASTISRASESVRQYAQHAADTVQETTHQAAESMCEGYADVEDMVRRRPSESLAVCVGVGIITGVVLGLMVRR